MIISCIYKKRGIDTSKNIVISVIVSICLLLFGFFSILPTSLDSQVNNYSILKDYKSIMDVRIPSSGQLKLGTLESFNYKNISDLEIITVNYEQEDTSALSKDILNNDNWILSTELSSELKKWYLLFSLLTMICTICFITVLLVNIILYLILQVIIKFIL